MNAVAGERRRQIDRLDWSDTEHTRRHRISLAAMEFCEERDSPSGGGAA
jgi:hypothetical protein